MPGLVFEGHWYRRGEARWNDKLSTLNTRTDAQWWVSPPETFILADERYADDEYVTAFRIGDTITVRQRIQWAGRTGRYPLTWQAMDAMARKADPTARLYADSEYGVIMKETWQRTYKVTA